jgi:serine/threonine protein kinase/tetratricopeptide (TPR) repeat protein
MFEYIIAIIFVLMGMKVILKPIESYIRKNGFFNKTNILIDWFIKFVWWCFCGFTIIFILEIVSSIFGMDNYNTYLGLIALSLINGFSSRSYGKLAFWVLLIFTFFMGIGGGLLGFIITLPLFFIARGTYKEDMKNEFKNTVYTVEDWNAKGCDETDLNKKIDYYDKALKINPDDADIWNNKGVALDKLSKHSEAIECYDKALKINPDDADIWNNKGVAFDDLSKHSEAIECYNKALKINPDDADIWNDKGVALDKLSKHSEAIECYDKALKINPDNDYARYNKLCTKGKILSKLKKYSEAIECYNKALKINPDDADIWNNKGVAFDDLSKHSEAIECYDKALKIDSNHENAKYNKKIAKEKIEKSKPKISLDLKTEILKLNRWLETQIIIENSGDGLVENLIIKIPKDDFTIRKLKPINIEGNCSKIIEIYLKPKSEGEIPLDIEVEYAYNNKKYTKSFFFKISVETENYQTPKEPYNFTPKPSLTTSLPSELSINYKNIELIGQGGFARVFKAVKIKDNTQVAIKIPKSLDSATGKSFIRELENWTKINHQNIIKVYDYNILPIPYFEMELCTIDLNEYSKNKNISLKDASFLVFNIAEGLKYAHSLKIIHRDLKPHNILLKDGIPKITDWGLSKVISQSTTTTQGGFTPYYASPEQINEGEKNEKTDIWQLGVIFYQMITNQLPFDGDTVMEIGMNILNKIPKSPKEINPEIDSKLNNIILKCINKKSEHRYDSILQLQKDLAIYLQISFKENLTKSISQKDFSRSVFYCGDLISMHLKADNRVEAYKYIGDLINYVKGNVKNDLNQLKQDIEYRAKNNIPISYEVVESAGVILHKVKLGFNCD